MGQKRVNGVEVFTGVGTYEGGITPPLYQAIPTTPSGGGVVNYDFTLPGEGYYQFSVAVLVKAGSSYREDRWLVSGVKNSAYLQLVAPAVQRAPQGWVNTNITVNISTLGSQLRVGFSHTLGSNATGRIHIDYGKQSIISSGSLIPTSFPELLSWWHIDESPSSGVAGAVWPARAGTQQINMLSDAAVGLGGTTYPDGTLGQLNPFRTAGFNWADPHGMTPWNAGTNNALTIFAVSRLNSVGASQLGTMAPLGNPASGLTNFLAFATISGGALIAAKDTINYPLTVLPPTTLSSKLNQAFAIVASYSNSALAVTILTEDGYLASMSNADPKSNANAAGLTINTGGGGGLWVKPTTSLGVIAKVLTQLEREKLCLGLMEDFGF